MWFCVWGIVVVLFRIAVEVVLLFNSVVYSFGILMIIVVWVFYYCVCVTGCVWFAFVVRRCGFAGCCSVYLVAIFGLFGFGWLLSLWCFVGCCWVLVWIDCCWLGLGLMVV